MKPISPFLAAFIKIMVPECEEHLRNETAGLSGEAMPPAFEVAPAAPARDDWR